jgi:hypothetical protein
MSDEVDVSHLMSRPDGLGGAELDHVSSCRTASLYDSGEKDL